MTTVEGEKFTVSLSGEGFAVVGRGAHDLCDLEPDEADYRETPYSLLAAISPGYTQKFGSNLMAKLSELKESQQQA